MNTVTFVVFSLSFSTLGLAALEYKVTGDHKWINTGNSWYTLQTSKFISFTGKCVRDMMVNEKKDCNRMMYIIFYINLYT